AGSFMRFMLFTALAALSEGPVTVGVLLAMGLYMLAQGPAAWRVWARFALACALAAALASFYALPALHYMPFTHLAQVHARDTVWANRFVLPWVDWHQGRAHFLIGLALT